MHMADALLSPAVGGGCWLLAGGGLVWAGRGLRAEGREHLVPLMGVSGAFVFAAQMLNFAIPGTGSSGHLSGGLLLSALLGPRAAFLTLASVLWVQALFFADGGLLAFGCNALNLGFFASFIAYPLVFVPLAGPAPGRARLTLACALSSVAALQLGALGVVVETWASGVSALPLGPFALLTLPIHALIGVVEGFATAAVLALVRQARPGLLGAGDGGGLRLGALGLAAAALAGTLCWFASPDPDGLEWSLARAATHGEPAAPQAALHASLAGVQDRTAIFPDYAPPGAEATDDGWPAVDGGTSLAGLAGTGLTLLVAAGLGLWLRRRAPTDATA